MSLNQLQLSLQFGPSAEATAHRELLTRSKVTTWIRHALAVDAEITVRIVDTEEGQKQIQETLDIYRKNAAVILAGAKEAGLSACGGVNSPYVWLTVPEGMTSWDFFDFLLNEAEIICTPGSGFGPCGEGYVRLTSFNTPELTKEAVERMKKALAAR